MIKLKRNQNPYFTTKPRVFFGNLKSLYQKESMRSSGGLKYDPDWASKK